MAPNVQTIILETGELYKDQIQLILNIKNDLG